MALPEKAIEQLAREPVATPGWAGRLLMFSFTLFFISLVVYLGMRFGYTPYLLGQVDDLGRQMDEFSAKIPASKQEKIINLHSQFKHLGDLLGGYSSSFMLLEWVEEHTAKDVFYTKFDFEAKSRELTLNGQAKTSEDVVRQLSIFRDARDAVQEVRFQSMSAAQKGAWHFTLSLFFSPSFFGSHAAAN